MIMNRLVYFIPLLLVLILASCSPEKRQDKKIKKMEAGLFSDINLPVDQAKIKELTDLHVAFADTYPSSDLAAEHLFSAGNLAMNFMKPDQAISIFDRILRNYPDYEKIPQCLFLKGFIYENNLGQLGQAETIYREFLGKYPGHELADDVQESIKNLGKTPEELLMEFQKRAKSDSLQ
jgi:outer membrane protein assembly factor BamD (BamD/ComL family)